MRINNFKINGFGKLKDKQIDLKDGINIIYGENESGKSSILKFISAMFYGASKNKNGKDISDFDRYKPWISEEFSGKIDYTLDNGENFEVYREFKKKNPVIYNEQKEDISKTFMIDKTKGIDFFIEQTGIDEETFYSTMVTEQEGIKLSKSSQNSIIQKISNLVSTGNDNISYKKSLDKINKSQNEEVGTERTSQRPINLIQNKINKLMEKKEELELYKDSIYDNSIQKENLKEEQKEEENKKEFLKELKTKMEENTIKNAEINFNKKLEKEYNEKIEELNKKISSNKICENNEKINLNNYYLAVVICIIAFIILMIVNPLKIVNVIALAPIVLIIYKIFKDKQKSKLDIVDSEANTYKIINEIDILKENKENQKAVAEEKQEKLLQELEEQRKELINKYMNYINIVYIEEFLRKNYEDILKEIDIKENRINTIKFKLQTMENTSKDINSKLDNLSEIEEELQDAETEKDELLSLNNSYNIAKECLEIAYNQVKENISPKFTRNLCDIISKVSDNRYSNVILNDNEGLNVELKNGSYVPASRLSVGTIDQMYLSLRLSALEEISKETMPIILDEAFAYFDDERLSSILKYVKTNFEDNQIIIFTCSNREIKALENLKIEYNLINLEK